MRASRKSLFSFQNTGGRDLNSGGDKFQLVNCPRNGVHCRDILPQINQFYSEAELARINKEYQRSIELLQQAYYKTLELDQPSCVKCVGLFHANIRQTLETLHKELDEISSGGSAKKRFRLANLKTSRFFVKMNFLRVGEVHNN